MENGFFSVDTDALSRDTDALRTQLRGIDGKLTEMFASLSALNRAWHGPANETFARQFRNDWENTKELCDVLKNLMACIESAAKEYEKAEKQAREAVDAVRI